MEVVKDFCTNAATYSMQQLRDSVRSLQSAVKGGVGLTPQAVNVVISKLGDTWTKYR